MARMRKRQNRAPSPLYAEVVLPVPVDHPFTYAVPEPLRARAAVGMRAVVPVMRRIETGYIVGFTDSPAVEQIKELLDLPDEHPVFNAEMLALSRWIADYYCCAWGEALQCALPPGMRIGMRMRYRLVPERLDSGRFSARQRKVVAALYSAGPLTEAQLAKRAGAKALSNTLQALVRRGVLLAEPLKPAQGVSIRTETWVRLSEEAVPDNDGLMQLQRRAPKQAAVYFDLLHGDSERAATALYDRHGVNAAILKALADKGLVERFERELYRAPETPRTEGHSEKHRLTGEQQAAHAAALEALDARRFQCFLMHGVTGSGKTEVYLQVIEHALTQGRDAIILVPEISLTPQTVGRFYARFKENIAVLHSGLSLGERFDEWRRAQRGEVRIVVGARSAVFAPLPDVGVIVVDEEHDTSYKQGETPRYHARNVAIMRAQRNKAVCILGSATPSVESYHNAERGKSVRLDLPSRATAGALPTVHLIDMRAETRETAGEVMLSRTLEEAIQQRLDAGEQAILLLNRRGFSPFVLCPQCGWVAECEDCQVSLTYHSHGGVLRCHYCNATQPKPAVCGACGFQPLIYVGTGTQKLEDYLMRSFAGARIERMDADTTAGKGGHAKILGRFAAGEIDVLLGTQMLAKGHDYPGVTLVGVVHADTGLAMPDFRAAEQTFQLLTQVAGRAGRGAMPGEVYIQTYRPNHYAVRAAREHDYATFYADEIAHRRDAGYPPFQRMCNLAIESEDPQLAERHALLLRRVVRAAAEAHPRRGLELLGPAPAAVRRVKKRYRWHLALLARDYRHLNAVVRASRDEFTKQCETGKVQLKVDLDPHGAF